MMEYAFVTFIAIHQYVMLRLPILPRQTTDCAAIGLCHISMTGIEDYPNAMRGSRGKYAGSSISYVMRSL